MVPVGLECSVSVSALRGELRQYGFMQAVLGSPEGCRVLALYLGALARERSVLGSVCRVRLNPLCSVLSEVLFEGVVVEGSSVVCAVLEPLSCGGYRVRLVGLDCVYLLSGELLFSDADFAVFG